MEHETCLGFYFFLRLKQGLQIILFNFNVQNKRKMAISPIRANLLSITDTPAKMIVSCDINSWQETNLKGSPYKPNKLKTFQRRNYTRNKCLEPHEYTNLVSLKNRKSHLMASNTKAQLTHQAQTTRASTQLHHLSGSSKQKQSQSQCKSIKQFSLKLTEIKVSEFKQENYSSNNLICYRNKKQLPPFLTKNINSKIKKGSMKSNSEYINSIQNKLLHPKLLNQIHKKGSNLLSKNPETSNLIFKTRRILSVRQVQPTI